jgi:hypothetical protein
VCRGIKANCKSKVAFNTAVGVMLTLQCHQMVVVQAEHVPGTKNVLTDALSRGVSNREVDLLPRVQLDVESVGFVLPSSGVSRRGVFCRVLGRTQTGYSILSVLSALKSWQSLGHKYHLMAWRSSSRDASWTLWLDLY